MPAPGPGFLTFWGYCERAALLEANILKEVKTDKGEEVVSSPLLSASAFLSGQWVDA